MRQLAKYLLVTALMLSVGGQWALVQTAAWAGMLVSYAQQGSVSEALSKTFDGQHPCKLCKLVDKGTKDTQKKDSKSPDGVKKMELFASVVPVMCIATPESTAVYYTENLAATMRSEIPRLTPPRLG